MWSINKHLAVNEDEFPWPFVNKDEQSGVDVGEDNDSGTRSVENQQFEGMMGKKQQWGLGVGQEQSGIAVWEGNQFEQKLEQMNEWWPYADQG